MMEIRSVDAFVRWSTEAVYRALSPSEGAFKRVVTAFRSLRPSLTVDESGKPELSVAFAARTASDTELCEAFDLPEKLSDRQPVVVAIDEFQKYPD